MITPPNRGWCGTSLVCTRSITSFQRAPSWVTNSAVPSTESRVAPLSHALNVNVPEIGVTLLEYGPFFNNVTPISGTFTFNAWDKGATRDSVDGTAEFVTQDGARWKLVMDRVQTKDVPHHPRFGGVIMGLYYHGVTQVHTPLVPTIN